VQTALAISVGDEIEVALAGRAVTFTVEKRERFPVRIRYARANRKDEESIRRLLISPSGMATSTSMGTSPGTAALTMAFGMSGMIYFYLAFTVRRIGPGPDDRDDAEPYEGAGEQGFFSPHSWWPIVLAGGGAAMFTGIAVGFWLCYFAAPFMAYGVYGLVFEYYRGENKHY